ncbi:hypothetical protein FJ881_24365 [Escherichia albertii]|nr:hypothetical protein [Escherichia albertii]QTA12118.1 hypothetical protein FYK20_14850 [Escherichia albertii]
MATYTKRAERRTCSIHRHYNSFLKKVFTILHTCVYCSQKKHACNNILLKIVLFYSHIMIGMLTLVTNIVHKMG